VTGDTPAVPDAVPEGLLRELAPQVLGALIRRFGTFETAEDAVQEALLAAAIQWPADGVPDNPRGWLLTVASRRLTDQLRSEVARHRRETASVALLPAEALVVPAPAEPGDDTIDPDDTLVLLFMCCHPALSPASQLALTLRAVGGLTTEQIARAFLVPDATMYQRISRAKQRIRTAGARFELPPDGERAERLQVVLQVLYLIFNEGYTATSGEDLQRPDLTAEAIRLARDLHGRLPDEPEVAGLLALMLLTDARRPARTLADGSLVPLDQQDRGRWNRAMIAEGTALVRATLARGPAGPYQVQAAIAAVHDEAPRAEDTDWPQVLALYELLEVLAPNPMVTVSRAVALAEVRGPQAGLALLESLDGDPRLADNHRAPAVRAHLLERAGQATAAIEAYRLAARLTSSVPERRYLTARADRLVATTR
jgi:RNA polymerase sigma factor (sigma-70 family)